MNLRTAIAALVVTGTVLVPGGAHAAHGGCFVVGEVQGLDTERNCSYTATSGEQLVVVATPYEWRVWVVRYVNSQPETINLAHGEGPPAGIVTVEPEVGETVHVTMSFGCTPPYCGTIGFLGAGLEQGHP